MSWVGHVDSGKKNTMHVMFWLENLKAKKKAQK
jgi:hypothetical protein